MHGRWVGSDVYNNNKSVFFDTTFNSILKCSIVVNSPLIAHQAPINPSAPSRRVAVCSKLGDILHLHVANCVDLHKKCRCRLNNTSIVCHSSYGLKSNKSCNTIKCNYETMTLTLTLTLTLKLKLLKTVPVH